MISDFPTGLPAKLVPVWREMAPQVRPRIGLVGMESLCWQVVRMRDAQARIDAEGMIVADTKGAPVPHPAIVIERQAQAQVRSWLLKYGASQ